ncbi:MAG: type IV pilus modification protein PilV [Pseudomonas sp.]|uniref:type IV pilus modification protein PilV n=1 Tax=Pseudomonas sp. TaxID=306 RepID=UPI002723B469|nr:type IV pilus modification protein PilV [Pseudomonas sp.]MDO9617653.1 type IV pilus modification protein PilV [Pseudomonas sp.]MDP2445819.1 type IV pilus modification protein PilV [Pseudomonas sp.]MDZ4335387.1 type IV pilus modification protein PilV [Pseudomonas sp.]
MKRLTQSHSNGFTLIEVMIAMIILAVGLLGMASLTVRSQQSNESAYARSQASLLAYDIIERMRANKVAFSALEARKVSFATQSNAYAFTSLPTCATPAAGTPATPAAQATKDLAEWCTALRNSLPSVNAGQTLIARTGNTYRVHLAWQDSGPDNSAQFVEVVAEL